MHDNKSKDKPFLGEIEDDDEFILICFAGIRDALRPEVPGAVKDCKTAGVRVRMVTGDNIVTARAIAKDCGIINEAEASEQHVCMTGPDFCDFVGGLVDKKTKEPIAIYGKEPEREIIGNKGNMEIIRNKLKVLARSRPSDKYIIVAGLRELGDIVAVTGDGTNDAPALKKADVGFAMKTGTQVAHAACDIQIQDDNFASIVAACKWGRNVFDNIRRFLQFQLTVNVCALVIAFIGGVIMAEPPLTAIQFLWVNMIMDTLAALALATEDPKPELLHRPPYRKTEYIISQKMVKHILGQTALQMIILFTFVFAAPQFVPEQKMPDGYSMVKDIPADHEYWKTIGVKRQNIIDHPNPKYRDWDGKYVLDGSPKTFDGQPGYLPFRNDTASRHLSLVFNIFVWFQIINMICSRKINDEINVFANILDNWLFGVIWVVICVLQVIMIQLAGKVMKVHNYGLTGEQWLMTSLPALIVFLFNFILKYIDDGYFPTLGDETEEAKEKSKKEYLQLSKIRDLSNSVRQGSYINNKM